MANSNPAPNKPAFTGRGGAGNIAPRSPNLNPADLETPTIKQKNYSTGRGGSGNIVSNDDPANARKAQDVGPSASAMRDDHAAEDAPRTGSGDVGKAPAKSARTHSFGRGGAANVVRKVKEVVKGESAGEKERAKEVK